MKKLIYISILLMSVTGQARVSDFNSMIEENAKEQTQLHKQIKGQIRDARQAMQKSDQNKQNTDIVEVGPSDYMSPTNKDMLTFEKEKTVKSKQSKKDLNRLSTEIKEMNSEF